MTTKCEREMLASACTRSMPGFFSTDPRDWLRRTLRTDLFCIEWDIQVQPQLKVSLHLSWWPCSWGRSLSTVVYAVDTLTAYITTTSTIDV